MNTSEIDEQLARLETEYKEWRKPTNMAPQRTSCHFDRELWERFQSVLPALSELYLKAERAVINPQSHFEYVGAISSKEKPSGASESVLAIPRDLHGYAVLKERRMREE